MPNTRLCWDLGTAYDLFVSLWVLHEPVDFGVRAAWAAGVRARLPVHEREMLDEIHTLLHVPFHWVYALPEPKNAGAALGKLGEIPVAERVRTLTLTPEWPSAAAIEILEDVAARQGWVEADRQALAAACRQEPECDDEKLLAGDKLTRLLDWWARSEEFGTRCLTALTTYHEVFFAEEERRIAPALAAALARAQELAARLDLLDLLEELSQGIRFEGTPDVPELVLAPTFWGTPLMFFGLAAPGREIRLFGARPADASLIPGEMVPDALLQPLKALSDPTRLCILHYLAHEPQTPAELARRLRLRPPTVTHHLQALRLAGLVQLKLSQFAPDDSQESRRYAARPEAVRGVCDALQAFLHKEDETR